MAAKKEKKTSKQKKKIVSKKKTEAKEEKAKPAPKEEAPKTESKEPMAKKPDKETAAKEPEAPKPAARRTKKAKKPPLKKKKGKVAVARGKRKEAVARATICSGKGVVRINSINLDSFGNRYVREVIREPIRYVGPEANSVNIHVNVFGGGAMGQAQAARTAIANALLQYFDELNLKEKFISIDRSLVVEDTRRVEPKKYKGPKARARYQKSYR